MNLQEVKIELHNVIVKMEAARLAKKQNPCRATREEVSKWFKQYVVLRDEKKRLKKLCLTDVIREVTKGNIIDNDIIASVGIELEGGCNNKEYDKIKLAFPDCEKTSDGSVTVGNKEIRNCELKYWNKNISKVFDFVKRCFSEGYIQNQTCGNHVHLKINPDVVGILTTEEFNNRIVKWYKETYKDNKKYLDRLTGSWARPNYDINRVIDVMSTREKTNRYYFVNCNSFPVHGTIELRIMPCMASADEYVDNVSAMLNKVIEIVNSIRAEGEYTMPNVIVQKDWLANQSIATTKLRKKIMIDGGL